MKKALLQSFKTTALELPVYAVFVTCYILVVLRYLEKPLENWFKTDRRLYAAVALGLIIGQGFMLELATRLLGRISSKGETVLMDFAVSHTHISPVWLVLVGFIVGVFGGFFGVGGSFLAGPALFGLGLPMNFVVGTDLAHIVGKSVVAAQKHRKLGNIDFRLGGLMVIGTIGGVELGAQFIQYLKRTAHIDLVVGLSFIIILVSISSFMAWETAHAVRAQKRKDANQPARARTLFHRFSHWLQQSGPPPYVSLPTSQIKRISVVTIVLVSFVGGFFSGFLGGGAGYIRMPSMVYILGIPTHVAVGTDLFEIIISAGYGTFTHALKGNVDILIALVMHTGAAVGAHIGAALTEYFDGVRIRIAFIPLPLIGAALIIYGLVTGHKVP